MRTILSILPLQPWFPLLLLLLFLGLFLGKFLLGDGFQFDRILLIGRLMQSVSNHLQSNLILVLCYKLYLIFKIFFQYHFLSIYKISSKKFDMNILLQQKYWFLVVPNLTGINMLIPKLLFWSFSVILTSKNHKFGII